MHHHSALYHQHKWRVAWFFPRHKGYSVGWPPIPLPISVGNGRLGGNHSAINPTQCIQISLAV
jgi:hypothetical protein